MLLTKADGSIRFAIDYRKLNAVTRKDAYPLPQIDATLDSLHGSTWFSSLDLRSGYWNIPLAEDSKAKTAFTVPQHGLYEFERMPFGLSNAPATFQRLMDKLMPRNLSRVYLDDIIVPGKSFSEALAHLRVVFQRVLDANFLLHPKKCHLFARKLHYLGHVVSADGIHTNPEKTEKISSWTVPLDNPDAARASVHSFVALAQYYCHFVPHFGDLAAPLHRLKEKSQPFEWTPEAQQSFDGLKAALTKAPVLAFPDPDGGGFILDTDASNCAIGAVLSQVQGGEEKVIAYFSRLLDRTQRNYCVTRKELLAIVQAIRFFHHYLYGRPFLVRTDHSALQWLWKLKNTAEGQLARWLETLAMYDFSVQHRPGKLHGNADSMSRRPCDPECRHCEKLDGVRRVQLLDDGPSADVCAGQITDLDIAPILLGLQRGERPTPESMAHRSERSKALWLQWASLELVNGSVRRRFEDCWGRRVTRQIVVPHAFIPAVLTHFHDAPGSGGHLGMHMTVAKIRVLYYWPGMYQDTKLWCLSCTRCRRKKGPGQRIRAPLHVHTVGIPWERVAVDIAGRFPRTDRGNRYLLIAVDYFSKWPEAIPIPSLHSARRLGAYKFGACAPC